jgi:hypothetical protein
VIPLPSAIDNALILMWEKPGRVVDVQHRPI